MLGAWICPKRQEGQRTLPQNAKVNLLSPCVTSFEGGTGQTLRIRQNPSLPYPLCLSYMQVITIWIFRYNTPKPRLRFPIENVGVHLFHQILTGIFLTPHPFTVNARGTPANPFLQGLFHPKCAFIRHDYSNLPLHNFSKKGG